VDTGRGARLAAAGFAAARRRTGFAAARERFARFGPGRALRAGFRVFFLAAMSFPSAGSRAFFYHRALREGSAV
jgi:hypothetical protein